MSIHWWSLEDKLKNYWMTKKTLFINIIIAIAIKICSKGHQFILIFFLLITTCDNLSHAQKFIGEVIILKKTIFWFVIVIIDIMVLFLFFKLFAGFFILISGG
jgi:hypothetical protein